MATSLPSLAMYIGSSPSISQAPATSASTAIALSCSIIPTPDCCAISLSVVARPPRVGSRSTRTAPSGTAASRRCTSSWSGALSETMAVPNSIDARCDNTATPCSPMLPDSSTTSPARAFAPPISRARGATPTPVVVMKTPSPLPRSTTFVSPVTTGTPQRREAPAIECTTLRSVASGKPSSRMKAALRYTGLAPSIATSFTVP
jgi:hypothetical protein